MTVDFNYPYTISADTPAVAAQVQDNFADLLTWIKANYRQKDDTPLLTVMPTLPGTPTIGQHAATKTYVDGIFPISTILPYGGTILPDGFLWCDGASYSTTGDYQDLFGYIGYAFGGSGGNFNVPNMANKITVGKGAGDFATLGATGGQADPSLTQHLHSVPQHGHSNTITYASSSTDGAHSHTSASLSTSGTGSHAHVESALPSGTTVGGWLYSGAYDGVRFDVYTGSGLSGARSTYLYSQPSTSTSGSTHSHTVTGTIGSTSSGHNHTLTKSGSVTDKTAFNTENTGTATVTNDNYPPYVVVNYIIKA